jgi:hypothetical protein
MIDEVLANPNKYFSSKKLTPAEQILLETEWTEYLSLVDFGNTHLLKNFRYGLNMQDNVGEKENIDYC